MSTAIVYYSQHHGNTKKLLDAIKEYDPEVKLIDTTKTKVEDLSPYDRIGIASGIYFGRFNKDLTEYIKNALPHAIKVFGIYTCGNPSDKYTKEIKSVVNEKGCKWIGEYGCRGSTFLRDIDIKDQGSRIAPLFTGQYENRYIIRYTRFIA